jgi:hypothetical protein
MTRHEKVKLKTLVAQRAGMASSFVMDYRTIKQAKNLLKKALIGFIRHKP